MQLKLSFATIAIAALLTVAAQQSSAQVTSISQYALIPSGSWNDVELISSGNQTANIQTESPSDNLSDPFATDSPSPIGVTFNSGANQTDIDYPTSSATDLLSPTNNPQSLPSAPTGAVFVGLQFNNPTPPAFSGIQFKNTLTNPTPVTLPVLSITPTSPLPTGAVHYVTFFAQYSAGGTTQGEWFEVPYTPGTTPSLQLFDSAPGPFTLSNVGFQLSNTEIPLDNLNFSDEPPPGAPGSTFTPYVNPPILAPNQTVTLNLPEPGSLSLLALAALSTLKRRRSR